TPSSKQKMSNRTDLLMRYRRWFVGVFQPCLFVCSLVVAWLLRFDFSLPFRFTLFFAFRLLVPFRFVLLSYFGLLTGWWKYVGIGDGIDILKAVGSGSALFWILMRFVFWATAFPRTIYVLEPVLTAGLLIAVRLLSRAIAESVSANIVSSKKVILLGAGSAAHTILREIRRPGSSF